MAEKLQRCATCDEDFKSLDALRGHACLGSRRSGRPRDGSGASLTKYRQIADRCQAVINAGQITTLTEFSAAAAQRGADPRLVALAIERLARNGLRLPT